jgi:two-component system CitB family sensor kinase
MTVRVLGVFTRRDWFRSGGREPRRRRLSGRILVAQLAILAITGVIGFALLGIAQRAELDRAFEERAVAIANTAASEPQIRQAMQLGEPPSATGVVQSVAERIRLASGASYVVVIDLHRVRHSHPDPTLIGAPVTEPLVALDGRSHVRIDTGSTGRSANGLVPLYGTNGALVGEVSAGIPETQVSSELWHELPTLGLYAGFAAAVGLAASLLLSRRLKRITFGLELEEIAGLLQDREAMLHGIREGVVAFDPRERVSVINTEAARLLGLADPAAVRGMRLTEVLPDGRLRRVLDGTITGQDLTVLTDEHCLVVNRMPVALRGRELGSVVTVRDRTELVAMVRELDSMRGLTDALRAQQHEFSNRMHTLAGLLELGEYEAALDYALESAGAEPALAESVRDCVGNALMVGLIVAKTTVAAERGVRIALDDRSRLSAQPPHLRRLLTIVGNLLDNAIDAAASAESPHPGGAEVRLLVAEEPERMLVQVADSGPGVPPEARERIFEDGWSTRPDRGTARRGLGLALVHRLVQRHGGTVEVSTGPGACFTVTLPLPDLDPDPLGAVESSAPPFPPVGDGESVRDGERW